LPDLGTETLISSGSFQPRNSSFTLLAGEVLQRKNKAATTQECGVRSSESPKGNQKPPLCVWRCVQKLPGNGWSHKVVPAAINFSSAQLSHKWVAVDRSASDGSVEEHLAIRDMLPFGVFRHRLSGLAVFRPFYSSFVQPPFELVCVFRRDCLQIAIGSDDYDQNTLRPDPLRNGGITDIDMSSS
jgi:hypothetical protein